MPTELQSRAHRTSGAAPWNTAHRAQSDGDGERQRRHSARRCEPRLSRPRRAPPCRPSPASRCTPTTANCSRWSAPAAAARPRCWSSICGLQAPDAGTIECAPAALMPQRDLLLPWLSAVDNAGARAAHRRPPRAAGPRTGGGAVRRARPGGLRGRPPARALRGDAPARRVPAHAALGQARALPGRAVRRARRDHARGDAGVARPRAGSASRARSCSSPTTSRRRSCSPTASRCSPPAPAGCARRSRSTSPAPARAPTRQ